MKKVKTVKVHAAAPWPRRSLAADQAGAFTVFTSFRVLMAMFSWQGTWRAVYFFVPFVSSCASRGLRSWKCSADSEDKVAA